MNPQPQGLACEEAHHRFLNTLTSLGALLRQDFAGLHDPKVRDAVATFEAQLQAFAGIHRSLQASPSAANLDVVAHFGRLCGQICAAQLAPHGVACEFYADEGEMDPVVGEKLGLILVELLTNAAKHAFAWRSRGCVSIALRRVEAGWTCVVRDDGAGQRSGPAGSGLRLIDALARGIGGSLTTSSDETGFRVAVRLPDQRHTSQH
jgi:two-component sensor histidine kinase